MAGIVASFITLIIARFIIPVFIYSCCGDTLVPGGGGGSESSCCARLGDTGTSASPVAISGHVCPCSVLFHISEKLTLEAAHVALLICAAAEEEEIFLHLMTPPGSYFSCMML